MWIMNMVNKNITFLVCNKGIFFRKVEKQLHSSFKNENIPWKNYKYSGSINFAYWILPFTFCQVIIFDQKSVSILPTCMFSKPKHCHNFFHCRWNCLKMAVALAVVSRWSVPNRAWWTASQSCTTSGKKEIRRALSLFRGATCLSCLHFLWYSVF